MGLNFEYIDHIDKKIFGQFQSRENGIKNNQLSFQNTGMYFRTYYPNCVLRVLFIKPLAKFK